MQIYSIFKVTDTNQQPHDQTADNAKTLENFEMLLTTINPQKFSNMLFNGLLHENTVKALDQLTSMKMAKLLKQHGVDINVRDDNSMTPLMWAAKKNNLGVFMLLVKLGAGINTRDYFNWTVLMQAVSRNQLAIVKLLVALCADINAKDRDGKTVLMWSSVTGNPELLESLKNPGTDINLNLDDWIDIKRDGWIALTNALHNNNFEAVVSLVERGVDIN
ncbi:MAG: ankyrin repeat domain-containing protein, partial [Endozoicomonadaceae bacterium]|nr:ankyrin repeat domain-containing protein [Endozoicomonadaceae bacterium]